MNRNVGNEAIILTISKVLTMLMQLVSGMLLARFRTLEEYGTYAQLHMAITLGISLFMLGLPNCINYFLARSDTKEEKRQFLSIYYTVNTILGVLVGIILVISIPIIEIYFRNDKISSFAFYLCIFPWASITITGISNVLVTYGQSKKLLALNLGNAASTLVCVVIVHLSSGTFREYMIMYLVCEVAIALGIYLIVYRLEKGLSFRLDWGRIRELLRYAVPIGLASLIGTLNIELDKLMIGRLFDAETLAVYTNASKELPVTILASSLTAVLLPRMAKSFKDNEYDKAIRLWGNAVQLSYLLICFCSMALVVFAPQIMTILYSEKYLSGVSIFRVYSLVLLLRTTYFGLVLNTIGKTKFIMYSSIVSFVLNCGMNYLLYMLLGVIGPALATLISLTVVGVAQLYASAKLLGITLVEIFPWKKLLQTSCLNCVIGVILFRTVSVMKLSTDLHGICISIILGVLGFAAYVFIEKKQICYLWEEFSRG